MLLTEEQKRKQRAERNRQVAREYRLTPRGGSAPTKPAGTIVRRKSPLAPLRPGEFAEVVPLAHARNTKRYKQRTGA